MTPLNEKQGDGVIRRRSVRLLLISSAVSVLFGCDAGNQLATRTPAAPVAVPVRVVAARVVVSTTEPGPAVSTPATTVEPAPAPTVANEMQLAPTTTAPATTIVALRPAAPAPTPTAVAVTFEPAASPIPLNIAAAADFASRTNSLRSSLGLAALVRNAQLDTYAANWARELAASGSLRHSTSPDRAVANGWNIAGENVGFGSSVGSVQDALVASAGHYANLAGPSYSALGIAVVVGADGRLWVCEVFGG